MPSLLLLLLLSSLSSASARKGPAASSPSSSSSVIELDPYTFDAHTSSGEWLVAFTAPWCGHCKTMKPHLAEAARSLRSSNAETRIGNVDASKYRSLVRARVRSSLLGDWTPTAAAATLLRPRSRSATRRRLASTLRPTPLCTF
jgi:thiol-disulfide isomerase/thioredoxin